MFDIKKAIAMVEERRKEKDYQWIARPVSECSIYFASKGNLKKAQEWARKAEEMADLELANPPSWHEPYPQKRYPPVILAYWLAGMQKELDKLIEKAYPLVKSKIDAPYLFYALHSDKKKAKPYLRKGVRDLEKKIDFKEPFIGELLRVNLLCITYLELGDLENTKKWLEEFERLKKLDTVQPSDCGGSYLWVYYARMHECILAFVKEDADSLKKAAYSLSDEHTGLMGNENIIANIILLSKAIDPLRLNTQEFKRHVASELAKPY